MIRRFFCIENQFVVGRTTTHYRPVCFPNSHWHVTPANSNPNSISPMQQHSPAPNSSLTARRFRRRHRCEFDLPFDFDLLPLRKTRKPKLLESLPLRHWHISINTGKELLIKTLPMESSQGAHQNPRTENFAYPVACTVFLSRYPSATTKSGLLVSGFRLHCFRGCAARRGGHKQEQLLLQQAHTPKRHGPARPALLPPPSSLH